MNCYQAFAAFIALGLTLTFTSAEESAAATIVDFSEDDDLGWAIVNDGVMGGLSKGKCTISDKDVMSFSGTLSLENNGDFPLVETRPVNLDLSASQRIQLRVKGDGREYQLRFESDATYRNMPVSFSATFSTEKGTWLEIEIPFSAFVGGRPGRSLPDETLNPSAIGRVVFLIGDKQPGPFALDIDWIRSY